MKVLQYHVIRTQPVTTTQMNQYEKHAKSIILQAQITRINLRI